MKLTKLLFLALFLPLNSFGQSTSIEFGRMKNVFGFLNEPEYEADIHYASNFIQIDYSFPLSKNFNGVLGYAIIEPEIGVYNKKDGFYYLKPQKYGFGHMALAGVSFKSMVKNERLFLLPQFLCGFTLSTGGHTSYIDRETPNYNNISSTTWIGNEGYVDFFLNPKIRAKLKVFNTFHLIANVGYQHSFGKNVNIGFLVKEGLYEIYRKTTFTTGTNFNYSIGFSICPSCI